MYRKLADRSCNSIAGGETVSTFLAAVTYFLLKNPGSYHKLQQEIRGRYQDESEITAMTAQQLPYLQAVISEGLRIYPPGSQGFPRTCPGATIDGHWVPKGVSIPLIDLGCGYSLTQCKFRLRSTQAHGLSLMTKIISTTHTRSCQNAGWIPTAKIISKQASHFLWAFEAVSERSEWNLSAETFSSWIHAS